MTSSIHANLTTTSSCQDISCKTKIVNLMGVLDKKPSISKVIRIHHLSHECLYIISWKFIQWRYLCLDPSGGPHSVAMVKHKLNVWQDSVELSLLFQLQLPSRAPDPSIVQGGTSILPQRRGGRGGGSAGILHRQLLPVPGHSTVGSAHSSCASPQLHGHTCTHTLHMQSIYTHTIPSCPAQVSC